MYNISKNGRLIASSVNRKACIFGLEMIKPRAIKQGNYPVFSGFNANMQLQCGDDVYKMVSQ